MLKANACIRACKHAHKHEQKHPQTCTHTHRDKHTYYIGGTHSKCTWTPFFIAFWKNSKPWNLAVAWKVTCMILLSFNTTERERENFKRITLLCDQSGHFWELHLCISCWSWAPCSCTACRDCSYPPEYGGGKTHNPLVESGCRLGGCTHKSGPPRPPVPSCCESEQPFHATFPATSEAHTVIYAGKKVKENKN